MKGTYTAIVTPFNEDLSVDFDSLKKNIENQVESGIQGVVVLGSTGEAMTLDDHEKLDVMLCVQEQVNGRIPIIVGTGSNSTQAAVEAASNAAKYNFDAVLIVCPYYNKPTQEGIFRHYYAVSEAVDISQVMYNVPSRSGTNITAETQLRIAEHCKNVVATKEASGNLEQMMQIIKYAPQNFTVLSGDDALALPCIASGGNGVISVLSNYAPKMFSTCISLALEGRYAEALKRHYELFELMQINFIESNPIPVKAIMSELGMIKNHLRLPLTSINKNNLEVIRKTISDKFIN